MSDELGPCGSEECWHAVNGRQCPPDPWEDLPEPEATPLNLPDDPPF